MRKLLIATVLMSISSPSYAEDAADLLLKGGVFYPVSSEQAVIGSMAIADGRIAFLGSDEEAEALVGPETSVLALEGRTVTPGLIDAHAHLLGLGRSLSEVDLVGTGSYEEVVELISKAAETATPGTWIMGRGWDQNDWPTAEFPDHEALSRAVPDHPVWMRRVDGHAALLNAEAMHRLGVDSEIEDPVGGRFLRRTDGSPSGVLIDGAMDAVSGAIPGPSADERRRWIAAGVSHCLARGLTTVTDMGISQGDFEAYAALHQEGLLAIRSALFLEDEPELLSRWLERGPLINKDARVLVRGIKLYADGALGSRGAALVEPYSDDGGNVGLLTTTSEHMGDVCARALAAGFQVGIHAIGDRGSLVALDAIESCFGSPRPEARFRLEHAQVMRLQDIERLGRLGVIASVQPTHATSDMPWAESRVGPQRIKGAYAWQRLREAGAVLALGSDFPVEKADPLLGFYAAVSRQDLDGRPPGGWMESERLSRYQALRGLTLDAAYSLFLDDEVGSLEEGKRADLVVFDRDPMTVPVREIPEISVALTLVEGEVVFESDGWR